MIGGTGFAMEIIASGARRFLQIGRPENSHTGPNPTPISALLDVMSLSSISQRNTLAKLLRKTTKAQRLPGALVEP